MCFLSVSKETVAEFDSLRVKCGESCHEWSVWMHEVNNPSIVRCFWRANVKKFLWVVYFFLCGSSFLCYYLKNTHSRTRWPWRNLNKSSNLCLTPKLKMPECSINLYIQSTVHCKHECGGSTHAFHLLNLRQSCSLLVHVSFQICGRSNKALVLAEAKNQQFCRINEACGWRISHAKNAEKDDLKICILWDIKIIHNAI